MIGNSDPGPGADPTKYRAAPGWQLGPGSGRRPGYDFVWDENVNRRHLNETQRGLAAAEMEILRHGGKRKFQEPHADIEDKPATRMEIGHQ
jgi:hypothetical protein